jgi:hypothetical protein
MNSCQKEVLRNLFIMEDIKITLMPITTTSKITTGTKTNKAIIKIRVTKVDKEFRVTQINGADIISLMEAEVEAVAVVLDITLEIIHTNRITMEVTAMGITMEVTAMGITMEVTAMDITMDITKATVIVMEINMGVVTRQIISMEVKVTNHGWIQEIILISKTGINLVAFVRIIVITTKTVKSTVVPFLLTQYPKHPMPTSTSSTRTSMPRYNVNTNFIRVKLKPCQIWKNSNIRISIGIIKFITGDIKKWGKN